MRHSCPDKPAVVSIHVDEDMWRLFATIGTSFGFTETFYVTIEYCPFCGEKLDD